MELGYKPLTGWSPHFPSNLLNFSADAAAESKMKDVLIAVHILDSWGLYGWDERVSKFRLQLVKKRSASDFRDQILDALVGFQIPVTYIRTFLSYTILKTSPSFCDLFPKTKPE